MHSAGKSAQREGTMKTLFAVAILLGFAFVTAPTLRAQDDAFNDPALAAAAAAPVQTLSPADVMKLMQDSRENSRSSIRSPSTATPMRTSPAPSIIPGSCRSKRFPSLFRAIAP